MDMKKMVNSIKVMAGLTFLTTIQVLLVNQYGVFSVYIQEKIFRP
jgi:hypothetical protein